MIMYILQLPPLTSQKEIQLNLHKNDNLCRKPFLNYQTEVLLTDIYQMK